MTLVSTDEARKAYASFYRHIDDKLMFGSGNANDLVLLHSQYFLWLSDTRILGSSYDIDIGNQHMHRYFALLSRHELAVMNVLQKKLPGRLDEYISTETDYLSSISMEHILDCLKRNHDISADLKAKQTRMAIQLDKMAEKPWPVISEQVLSTLVSKRTDIYGSSNRNFQTSLAKGTITYFYKRPFAGIEKINSHGVLVEETIEQLLLRKNRHETESKKTLQTLSDQDIDSMLEKLFEE